MRGGSDGTPERGSCPQGLRSDRQGRHGDPPASCSTPRASGNSPAEAYWPATIAAADAVLGFFGRTAELTAGTFRVEVHGGEREGRTLKDREVLVFHVRDGKVVEVWQYLQDQYTWDEFFF